MLPAAIHPDALAQAMAMALAAHRALGCRGASRADFRYDDTAGEPGRLVLLEVNTQPGLTPTSLLPEQAAHLRHRLPRAVRLDGGARRMPRVSRRSGAARPALAPQAAAAPAPAHAAAAGLGRWPASRWCSQASSWRIRPQGGGTIATLRERLGRSIDLRVADIEVDGRANTPEPLLRAALGVSRGDPILGFSVEGARARIERCPGWSTWPSSAACPARSWCS